MKEAITLTLTEEEARKVLIALKARASHWRHPGSERISNAKDLRDKYTALAAKAEQQYNSQVKQGRAQP